jgi:hypothetical protein
VGVEPSFRNIGRHTLCPAARLGGKDQFAAEESFADAFPSSEVPITAHPHENETLIILKLTSILLKCILSS